MLKADRDKITHKGTGVEIDCKSRRGDAHRKQKQIDGRVDTNQT